MTDRTGFTWTCSEGHEVFSTFTDGEIDQLEEDLKRGDVNLYCLKCGQSYRFGSEPQINIKKWITEHARRQLRATSD
jgi:hypothetical protein